MILIPSRIYLFPTFVNSLSYKQSRNLGENFVIFSGKSHAPLIAKKITRNSKGSHRISQKKRVKKGIVNLGEIMVDNRPNLCYDSRVTQR